MLIKYIDTEEKFYENLDSVQRSSVVCVDVETTGLDEHTSKLLLVQIAVNKNTALVYNAQKIKKSLMRYLLELIEAGNKLCIGHNIKFDLKFLYSNYNILLPNVFDTMLAEVIHKAGVSKPFYSFEYLAKKYLSISVDKSIRETFINKEDDEFTDEQIEYSAKDVVLLYDIYAKQLDLIKKNGQESTWELEMKLEPVVSLMEYFGAPFDQERWLELADESGEILEDIHREMIAYLYENFERFVPDRSSLLTNAFDVLENMYIPVKTKKEAKRLEEITTWNGCASEAIDKVNFNSPKQLKRILNLLGVDVDSTNAKVLDKIDHTFIDLILKYREYSKKVTTYGEEYLKYVNPKTGRIHTQFNQLRAKTGRFSSSSPNLQNIIRDKRYRHCFKAKDGYKIATTDYSQIELRITADVTGEPLFVNAYNDDVDLHSLTASLVFEKSIEDIRPEQRQIGKNLNFAVLYGTSANGMYKNFNIPVRDGKVYLRQFSDKYRILMKYIDLIGKAVLDRGFSRTVGGRKRFFKIPINPSYQEIKVTLPKIRRQGFNHVIQGTSADMIKRAIIYLYYESPFTLDQFRVILTVHDEIVVEFREEIEDEAIKFIGDCMEKAGKFYVKNVPVEYDIEVNDYWSK